MTADDHADAESPEFEAGGAGEADAAKPGEAKCWNCGSPLPDGAMFCGECGSAVGPRAARPAEETDAAPDAEAQLSADQDDAGTPPHGDALVETPTSEDGADPDGQPDDDSAAQSTDRDDAGTPPHGDAQLDSPADDPAPDGAPTDVQAVQEDHTAAAADDDRDGADPLAPLTPDERFAAERLLDPDSPADKFVLQFSTGESATVYGSGLVGRNPIAEPGEYVDHVVVIRDPGRSVSKTHLEFGQDNGAFWVLDRFSGNGSVLREPDGRPKRCEPGRRYFVPRGTRIEIGDQFFVVS